MIVECLGIKFEPRYLDSQFEPMVRLQKQYDFKKIKHDQKHETEENEWSRRNLVL